MYRVLSFTRYLPRHGWDCSVICAGAEDYWVVDPTLLDWVPPTTEVVRVAGGSGLAAWVKLWRGDRGRRPGGLFQMFRRLSDWWLLPDSYVAWDGRARGAAERLLAQRPFDAMLSSSPPNSVHLAACALRARHRMPWVADFRDPWMALAARTPPTRWHAERQRRLEGSVLETADLILAASRSHADLLERRLEGATAGAGKVVHLPNGFEPDREDPAAPAQGPPAGEAPPHFTLVFTGVLSLMPDVEVFLEALHDLLARRPEARRRLRAKLAGPYVAGYADRAVALGLTGIVDFMGPRPHAEARALQRGAGVLLLWQPRDFPTMVPGKLYEYLDVGRPIVAVLDPDTESASLVRRAGGAIVRPGDRAALAAEIERHYEAWRSGEPIAAGRPAWLEEHARSSLARRLASHLDRLVGSAA